MLPRMGCNNEDQADGMIPQRAATTTTKRKKCYHGRLQQLRYGVRSAVTGGCNNCDTVYEVLSQWAVTTAT